MVGTYVALDVAPWVLVAEMPWREAYHDVLRTLLISLIIILLMATQQFYISPRWYRILGYEPNAFRISLQCWAALIHPDDRGMVDQMFNHAMASHEAFAIEFRMKAKDNQWRWVKQ